MVKQFAMVMVQVLDSCEVSEFDCGDQELNSFIMDDAVDYHKNRLAESYLLKDEGKTVAYVTLLNDRVSVDSFDDKTSFNRFRRKHFENPKRLKAYPAIKVGRLAVRHTLARRGYGSVLLDFAKLLVTLRRYSGCRFLIVDAYATAVSFYEKNGFVSIQKPSDEGKTRLMCYDLMSVTV